jgi:hypothetical protein
MVNANVIARFCGPSTPPQAFVNHKLQGFVHAIRRRVEADLRRVLPDLQMTSAALAAGGAMLIWGVAPGFAQDSPRESIGPFYDIDWSLGLRGSYSSNSLTGGAAEAIVAPQATFTRNGQRDTSTLTTGGEFSVDSGGAIRTDALRLGAASTYDLDEWTKLNGSAEFSLTQLPPDDSSLPANTAIAPIDLTGTVQGSATRKLGRFDAALRLRGERFVEGPTTLTDMSTIDNTDQSYWLGEAGLRVGFELTPLISVFIDGSETYQKFDAPDPTLLKFLNGRTTELRGGLSYTLNSTLTAEVSAGRAWLDYDDPTLTDAPGWVYDASVTFAPDETLSLTGDFNSSIGPSSDTPGDTDVAYAATAGAAYEVNPWLKLRSATTWIRTDTLGSGAMAWGYSVGAGLDLTTSRHVVWTADYLFSHDEPATTPASDTHKVTVGVTFKR